MNHIPVVWLSLTRKRGSRAQASRLNDELSSSRRNLKAFRQQHNLNHSTLTRRLQQRQNVTSQHPQPPGWVRVELLWQPDPVSVGAPGGRRRPAFNARGSYSCSLAASRAG